MMGLCAFRPIQVYERRSYEYGGKFIVCTVALERGYENDRECYGVRVAFHCFGEINFDQLCMDRFCVSL